MDRKLFKPSTVVALSLTALLVRIPVVATAGLPTVSGASFSAAKVADLELSKDGTLVGQLVTVQGAAASKQPVALYADGKQVATATTAEDGYFRVSGLRGGAYQIVTANSVTPCRVWAVGSAPPHAQPSILLVSPASQVRGQFGEKLSPWGTVAGAVVIAGIVVGITEIFNEDESGS